MSDFDGDNGAICVQNDDLDDFSIFWWENGASSTVPIVKSHAIYFTTDSSTDHRCV